MIENDAVKVDLPAGLKPLDVFCTCTWCGLRMAWQWSIPTTKEANSPYQHRFYCLACDWRVTIETGETD